MDDLILCQRCKERRGAFRFETNSTICRDCNRLPEPKQMNDTDLSHYNRKLYKATVNVLAKDPEYKRWREEHILRCSQFGNPYLRGC